MKKQQHKDKLQSAVDCYLARNHSDPKRKLHPFGHWVKLPDINIWVIDPSERQSCCAGVKSGSGEKFPGQWLMNHCRSYRHVAKLHGIEESVLRDEVAKRRKCERIRIRDEETGQLDLFGKKLP